MTINEINNKIVVYYESNNDNTKLCISGCINSEINIRKSKLNSEWNIASPPFLYKTSDEKRIIIGGQYILYLHEGTIKKKGQRKTYRVTDPYFLKRIVKNSIFIPEYAKKDVKILDECNYDITKLYKRLSEIPTSLEASSWRYFKSSDYLAKVEIWQHLTRCNINGEIHEYTMNGLERRMNIKYNTNTEYTPTPIKKKMVGRKVYLPFQKPLSIINGNVLCLTSTPQSEKAGMIAELAIGTKINNNGEVTAVPLVPHSITNSINPFPNRILENREVVLRAISQALPFWDNSEEPIVKSEEHMITGENNIPTKNIKTARFAHPLCHNDGAILSRSAARKLTTYHKILEKRTISKDSIIDVEPIGGLNEKQIIELYDELIKQDMPFVVEREIGYNEEDDEKVPILSKNFGIVTQVERIPDSDGNDILSIEILEKTPIEVGSKMMDRMSNKLTISKIISDCYMPEFFNIYNGEWERLEMITNPDIVKRGTPAREMEERISIRMRNHNVIMYSKNETLEEVKQEYPRHYTPIVALNDEISVSTSAPVGVIAYAVLDHHPSNKLMFSNKVNTNFAGINHRGLRNFTWTDAMTVFQQFECKNIISEIQSYSERSNNITALTEGLEALGLKLVNGKLEYSSKIFKLQKEIPQTAKVIRKSYDPNNIEMTWKDTIADPNHEKETVYLEIPIGIQLQVQDLVSWSQSKNPENTLKYLNNAAIKSMNTNGYNIDHVYNNKDNISYLKVPGYLIHTHTDNTGRKHPNNIMADVNSFIRICENMNCNTTYTNIMFNNIIERIRDSVIQKRGLLREVISPRTAYSIFAVASNSGAENPNVAYIPIKALMKFAENKEFRKAYGISEGYNPSELYNIFNKKDYRCIIMRQPAHSRNEVSSFIVRPHQYKTIAICGAAMSVKDGDFDGDPLYCQMLLHEERESDMAKIKAEDVIINTKKSKEMCFYGTDANEGDSEYSKIKDAYFASTGQIIFDEKHVDRYNNIANRKSNDRSNAQAKAAFDFWYIKDGVANAGGIGNALRHLMYNQFKTNESIGIANSIYHKFAELCFDSKSSTGDAENTNKLFDKLRESDDPGQTNLSKELGSILPEKERRMLLNTLYTNHGKWKGGISIQSSLKTPFSRLLYRGTIKDAYRSIKVKNEHSIAKMLMSH